VEVIVKTMEIWKKILWGPDGRQWVVENFELVERHQQKTLGSNVEISGTELIDDYSSFEYRQDLFVP
jgi:hypothetical protein